MKDSVTILQLKKLSKAFDSKTIFCKLSLDFFAKNCAPWQIPNILIFFFRFIIKFCN